MQTLTWVVAGAIAGWLAGQIMKPGGYGIPFDVFLGVLSSLVAGWLFAILDIWPGRGMIGFGIVTVVGTFGLVACTRMVKRAQRRFLERLD